MFTLRQKIWSCIRRRHIRGSECVDNAKKTLYAQIAREKCAREKYQTIVKRLPELSRNYRELPDGKYTYIENIYGVFQSVIDYRYCRHHVDYYKALIYIFEEHEKYLTDAEFVTFNRMYYEQDYETLCKRMNKIGSIMNWTFPPQYITHADMKAFKRYFEFKSESHECDEYWRLN